MPFTLELELDTVLVSASADPESTDDWTVVAVVWEVSEAAGEASLWVVELH